MTLEEIFVLNNVLKKKELDSSEIYSLPSLANLNMKQGLYDTAKDLLIKRGLLKSHKAFTDEGILVAKRLMYYKAAAKYIQFLNLSIGILDNEKAVMIQKRGVNDYRIMLIDISDSANQFLKVFDFIKSGVDSQTQEERSLTPEELMKEYPNTHQNFRLKTKGETVTTDELYFLSDAQLYIYDYENQTLCPKSYADTIRLFQKRLQFTINPTQ